MARDPVCYQEVDEETAEHKAEYRGETYYFCTAHCRKKFEEKPEKYAKLSTAISIEPGASC